MTRMYRSATAFIFAVCILSSANAAPYYFEFIGSDHYKPQDKIFYSIMKPSELAPGLLREAGKAFEKLRQDNQNIVSDKDLDWEQEARKKIQEFAELEHRRGLNEIKAQLIKMMESPQSNPRLKSLAEHYFVARSQGWTETGWGFGEDSIKMFLLKTLFLKTLLYGSGKNDSEKINLINDLMQKIEIFHTKEVKSSNYRYVRIANTNDLSEFIKSLNSGSNFLNEEFETMEKEISLPAGVLGNISEIRQIHEISHESNISPDLAFSIDLFELDPATAGQAAAEISEQAIKKIYKEYEDKTRGLTSQSALDFAKKSRDHWVMATPRLTEAKLKKLKIEDLLGVDAHARKYFLALKDEAKLKLFEKADELFKNQWMKIRSVTTEVLNPDKLKFENKADERFFTLLISHYFSEISYEESKNIIKSFIERPDQKQPMDIFRLLILHAGPQMQKFVQILGRKKEFSAGLRNIFSQVEDQGLASSWNYAKKQLGVPPEGTQWVSLERDPNVGSIAETYKGTVKDAQDQQIHIAAGVIKNEIKNAFAKESPKLNRLAKLIDKDPILRAHNFPLVTPILSDIHDMAFEELDVEKRKQNQISAAKHYRASVKGKIVATIQFSTPETFNSPNSNVLYSSWVPGEKFSTFARQYPREALEVGEAIASFWAEKALFSGYFFHTDLHQGNLKVLYTSKDHVLVSFLDFGMTGQGSSELSSAILKLSLSKYLRSENNIADYLWQLSDSRQNQVSQSELLQYIKTEPDRFQYTAEQWLEWASSKGLRLRREVTAFHRGITAVNQLLQASGSKKTTSDIIVSVSRKYSGNSFEVIKSAFKDRFFKSKSIPEKSFIGNKCQNVFVH